MRRSKFFRSRSDPPSAADPADGGRACVNAGPSGPQSKLLKSGSRCRRWAAFEPRPPRGRRMDRANAQEAVVRRRGPSSRVPAGRIQ